MPAQNHSRNSPRRQISKETDATVNVESSRAEDSYEGVNITIAKFKLSLAASAQALQDAPKARSALTASLETRLPVCRINPIYRIPPETWAQIFKLAIPSSPRRGHVSLNPRDPLHVIDSVCQGWRTVIRSLPEVWCEISLSGCWRIPPLAEKDIPSFLLHKTRTLTNVLLFSIDLPLRISIHLPETPITGFLVPTLMHILVQHSHRWKSLKIADDTDQSAMRALTLSLSTLDVETFPLLEHMYIGWNKEKQRRTDDSAFPSIEDATPKLRSLHLVCNYSPSFITWSQLEILSLSHIPPSDVLRLLPELDSVVHLTLKWDNFDIRFDSHPRDFELSKVETFVVSGWNSTFFESVIMPKLRVLKVEDLQYDSDNAGFANFITRSKCVITEFTCRNYTNRGSHQRNGLQRFLRSLPGLQTLVFYLHREEGTSDFLSLLNEMESGRMLYLPRLQMLDLSFDFAEMPLLTQFVDSIESRWRSAKQLGITGLLEVGAIVWEDNPEAVEQAGRVKQMKEEGLDVAMPDNLSSTI